MKVSVLFLLAGCLGSSMPLLNAQVSAPIRMLSETAISSGSAGSGSYAPVLSGDGRFLVFTSQANNLVSNDNNAFWLDVFVRDLESGTITLVSLDTNCFGGGDGNSFNPAISFNGRFIAFESEAANLVAGDTNGAFDVFVRDLATGTTTLVSICTNGVTSGGGASRFPAMTADGRWVAFESVAADLATGDTNGFKDVFVRDLQTGKTFWASAEAQPPGTRSESPSLSSEGQRVAFASDALFGGAKPRSRGEIYVRDLSSATTIWASSNVYALIPTNTSGAVWASNPSLSGDGRFVAFRSAFKRPGGPDQPFATNLYFHDLETQATMFVSSNLWEEAFPEMTPDGRFIAYESGTNVMLWDRQTGSNTLVSVDATGTNAANGLSYRPVLNSDGTRVAFLSDAGNLTTNGGNGQTQLYVRDLTSRVTTLASVNLSNKPGSSLSGVVPALATDGSRVAFWSTDGELVPGDQNKEADVFLRDLVLGTTIMVSFAVPGSQSHSGPGWLIASANSVSADGRFVVLSVLDTALVPSGSGCFPHIIVHDLATGTNLPVDALENPNGTVTDGAHVLFPTNFIARFPVLSGNGRYVAYLGQWATNSSGPEQVYVRDLQSQTNWLASRGSNGDPAAAKSYPPSLSGDGRLVVFQSDAGNIVPQDFNGRGDVFVRDLIKGTNALVSVNLYGTQAGNGYSTNPIISADGRWVVFQSRATDLVTNAVFGNVLNLFARDLISGTTALVSRAADGSGLPMDSSEPVINRGSRIVLFNSSKAIYLYDLLFQTNTLLCTNCSAPACSGDGRWVAFETTVQTNKVKDIMLLDLETGVTNLVSINRDRTGGGNESSTGPQITFDGRYIVFASRASDLVDNDDNGRADVFVRDHLLNTTLVVSLNRQGTAPGNSACSRPILGADGCTVLFHSLSSDLVDNDFNNNRDIFVLRLESGDSDKDSMSDDWEMAYFGSFIRDGTGDFDADGHTDLQEFLAGTDPANTGSVLTVLTLARLGGSTTLVWAATPGKRYRVQYRPNLVETTWTDLPGVITATGSSASMNDTRSLGEGRQFYRVVLVP